MAALRDVPHRRRFVAITGDPGTGKIVALRLLAHRLRRLPNVNVGVVEHRQSRTSDFYREPGDLFGVSLQAHNRWGGFKALRHRWSEHIAQTLMRPVLNHRRGARRRRPRSSTRSASW